MEELVVTIVFVCFIVASILVIRASLALGKSKKLFQQLASRYGGNVVNRFRPKMWFRYGSTMGVVNRARHPIHKEQTVLTVSWPDKKFRFDIGTPDSSIRENRHCEKLDSEEVGFTHSLNVRTNDLDEFAEMFNHGVRWKVDQLVDLLNVQSLQVSLANGKLKINKPGRIREFQQLDDVVRLSLELYDQMLLSKSEGIEFVDDAEAKILGDVKCPICSEDVIDDMVICIRCKTPHCRDCWQYNGHCATFACNETRYYHAGGNSASR